MVDYIEQIRLNNQTHTVEKHELMALLEQVKTTNKPVWFERSLFTNWTCGIADCKYCYLSTKPKLDRTAVRSRESILAEALVCRIMNWQVGYLTGGLRVESTQYMVELLSLMQKVLGYKPMMNYGPYSPREITAFAPHVSGMGCAIESFDPQLHEFICPSKPLSSLIRFLRDCQTANIPTFITIILGIGERKQDVEQVIRYVREYNISAVQLCFLKPQKNTVFDTTQSPDPAYMAWWTARLRIALPNLKIKIALVRERIEDFSLMLHAGADCFSRYFVFNDFHSTDATQLRHEVQKTGRTLLGNFDTLPDVSLKNEVSQLGFDEELTHTVLQKAQQYWDKLKICTDRSEV